MASSSLNSRLFRRMIALPSDHGSWVFLFTPLAVGLAAAGAWTWNLVWLVVAVLAAFLARQPLTMLVKAYSGRRSSQDALAAWFWIGVYASVGLLALAVLLAQGLTFLLWLALPAGPVFAWHLWLVSQRAERKQMAVEVVASGVLALAAPAACWVAEGRPDTQGWWLWGLLWFQSAASIVYAYLRLQQRVLGAIPPVPERWHLGQRALTYTTFNVVTVGLLAGLGWVPAGLPLPYLVQWLETLWGIQHPAVGARPTTIGFRQLAVSVLFTVMFIVVWR